MNQHAAPSRDALERVEALTSLLLAHGDSLAAALDERLFASRSPGAASRMLSAHGELLERSAKGLTEAHDAALREASEGAPDEAPHRRQRDEGAVALVTAVMDARTLIEAAYGDEALEHFRLLESPPVAAESLHDYVLEALHALRHLPFDRPSPLGFDLDFEPIADKLEERAEPLQRALEAIRHDTDQAQRQLEAYTRSREEFELTRVAVAQALSAFCLLARRPDLAAVVEGAIPELPLSAP